MYWYIRRSMPITNAITPNPLVSEAEFAGLEADIKMSLPLSYHLFLKALNGGIPVRRYFRCEELDCGYKLERLLSVAEVPQAWGNLEHEFVPNELVPIAQTIGAPMVC